MTTTVKVSAHCGADTEVQIDFADGHQVFLENGDTYETYVYGDKEVTIKEVPKETK